MKHAKQLTLRGPAIAAVAVLLMPILLAACGPTPLDEAATGAPVGLATTAAPNPAAAAASRPRPKYRSVRGV